MTKYELPFKIVHGFDYPEDMPYYEIREKINARLLSLKEKGFGGVVTNVAFRDYLKNEHLWRVFDIVLEQAKENDMRVWLYDEDGYPSGGAGGLTIDENPDFEARAVVMLHAFIKPGESHTFEFPRGHEFALAAASYKVKSEDITRLDAERAYKRYDVYGKTENLTVKNDTNGLLFAAYFIKKHVYEGTHAEHNVCECRRYIDITNHDAVRAFIKNTYEEYTKRCGDKFAGMKRENGLVEAMFTDEPSLMGVYLNAGLYPPSVHDKYDDTLPLYPMTTWGKNIDNRMMTKYGINIYDNLIYLFGVDTETAREVRSAWYTEMSRLVEQAYFEQISDYCSSVGLPFSGHILLEDDIRLHPIFEGNYFSLLRHMHCPGIDMLQSVPETVYDMAFTPKLVSSVAVNYGREHVMSEVSAHAQGGKVTDDQMLCSQLIQYVYGVDTFTSYYGENIMEPEKYNKYNRCIGAVDENMKGKDFTSIALYYPYNTIAENTTTNIDGLNKDGNMAKVKNACADGLMRTVKELNDNQAVYHFVDLELLENSDTSEGFIDMPLYNGVFFESLLIPPCTLTDREKEVISRMRYDGVHVYFAEDYGFTAEDTDAIICLGIEDAVRAAQSEGKPFKVSGDHKGVAALYRNGNLLLVNAENSDKKIYVDTGSDTSDVYDPLNNDYIFAERNGNTVSFTLKAYAAVIVK